MALDRPPLTLGILLLLAISHANSRECKFTCSGAPGSLINLEPGKSYQYDLSGTTVTTKPGAKGDVNKLGLSAKVEIVAGAGCENVITLSNVQTSGPDGKKYNLDKTLGSGPTKFGLQGGKLEELCVNENEALPSLNIKRAALSLLQAALTKESGNSEVTEIDVFGVCPTSLDVSKSGNSLIVKKSRNLNRCSHREGLNVPFPTSTYDAPSDIQGSAMLSGDLKVTQKFEGGVLKSAEAREIYEYNPSTTLEAPAKIVVNTKLTLTGSSAKALPPTPQCNSAKPLIFDSEHEREFKGTASEITSLLKKGCESRAVDSEDARIFSSLVNAVSVAPKNEILSVYNQAKTGAGFKDKDLAVKQLLDAIYSSVSASSVEAIAELIKSKELSGSELNLWYLRIGRTKHASRASLTSTLPLLDANTPTAAYLGLGALGARFCSEHKCDGVPEVETFQKKLAEPLLKKGCLPKSHKDEDQLISSLKGIANMNYLTEDVAKKLAEGFQNQAVTPRIRSALADTIRTDPHRSQVKEALLTVFKNPREDSELRIKAYLGLVGCPCGKVADAVKQVLDSGTSLQVGSFVVSHLRNVRASTNPDKASAKHHLGSIISTKRYPIDPRKFSQNHELSYSLDLLNLGAAAETNLIYSQKSWVPRVMSLNLTTQLYGHAINLLQLDARLENLDRVIESLAGPRGYLTTNSPSEVLLNARKTTNQILEKIASRYDKVMRPKRSAATWTDLKSIADKVKLGVSSGNDVSLDVSLKTLGSEVAWLKLHSAEGKANPDRLINDIFGKLDETINGAKDFDQDIRKHITFINHDITYPTSLGLALRLKAVGTGAVRVKVDGKIDLPAILKNPKETDVRIQLIPSAAIDLRGDINIDGIAVESGVRVSLNIHSSTGTDLTFRLLDGHGVDVKVGLPVSKQEIISVKTDISSTVKEDGKPENVRPVSFDVKRETYSGCFDQINPIIGLTFCGKVSVPWEGARSLSPAYGPSELSLSIEKDDETLNAYHFKIYQHVKIDKVKFELLFDTPNSKEDRKVSVNVDGGLKPMRLKVGVYSPWTQADLDGSVIDNDQEISASAKVNHDGAEYLIKAGAKKTKNGNQLKLEPIFEYKAPELKSSLVGRRTGQKGPQQAYSASGVILVDLDQDDRKWKVQALSLNTPRGNLVVDGTGELSDKGIVVDNTLTYGEDSVNIKGHALVEGRPNPKDGTFQSRSFRLAVSPSQYKDASFDIKSVETLEHESTKWDYNGKLTVTHGPDSNNEESRISIISKMGRDSKASSIYFSSQVTYPLFQVDVGANIAASPKSVDLGIKGKADKYNGGLKVKAESDIKKVGDYNVELGAEAMANSIALAVSRKIVKPTQSKFVNFLEIKPGGRYELNANVVHNLGPNDIDVQIDAEAKLPVEPKTLSIKTGLKTAKSESKCNLKAVAGGKVYIDAEGHIKKTDKPSGGYKVKLPGYIDSNGDFSYDGTNLKAKAKLDLPKSDRKADAKADLVTKDDKVSGYIDLCWDSKNPSKSLKIQTETAKMPGEKQGFTTKNTITLDGSKTVVNGKYAAIGKEIETGNMAEKGSASGEVELILPSGYKIGGKGSDSWDFSSGHAESIYGLTLEDPGKGPREINLKIVGKNFDTDPIKFDTQVTLSYLNPSKNDAVLHAILKKVPKDGGKWLIKGEVGTSGVLIEHPLTLKLDSEISENLLEGKLNEDKTIPPVNYRLSLAVAGLSIESGGKVAGTTIAGDFSAKLPEGNPSGLKSLKYSTSNNIDVIPGQGKHPKIKTSQQLEWDNQFVKAELEGSCEENGFRYSAEYETNALSKRKLSGAAHYSSGEGLKLDASSNMAWEGKTADVTAKLDSNKDGSVVGAHATAITPTYGKSDLAFKNKIIKEGKGWHTDLSLSSGDKKLAAISKIELIKDAPLVDINIDHTEGQSKLFFKNERKGPNHWLTDFKAKWSNNGGILAIQNEVNLENSDNLAVRSNVELPEHKKVDVDLTVKDGKKLSFTINKEGKSYLSGNANYDKKIEGRTKTISGKGEVVIEGKSYPLSYKGVYEELDDGDKFNFDIDAGKRKGSLSLLRTPDEFNWERTVCQDDGKCSTAFVQSKISKLSADEFEQISAVKFDFSMIDPRYQDVAYKSTFKRRGLLVDHNIELQWAKEKIKYNSYIHEKQSGVILALPKRTVGAELLYDSVQKGDKLGNLKIEADLWLNKEKNDKLCLIAAADVSRSKDGLVVTGETKLTHPALKKDLIVKGKASVNDKLGKLEGDLLIDIFRKPNQKIVAAFKSGRSLEGKSYTLHRSASIKSEGCKVNIGYEARAVVNVDELLFWSESASYIDSTGAKRDFSVSVEASPKKLVAKAKAPENVLGEIDLIIDPKQKELKYSLVATVGDVKYSDNLIYNLDNNHLSNVALIDGKKIDIEAGAKVGKSGILKVAIDGKSAAELNVALDEANFLKSKYSYDVEILKSIWHCLASAVINTSKALDKQLSEMVNKGKNEAIKIIDCFEDSVPDFSGAGKHIAEQLKQIKDELLSDPTLNKVGAALKDNIGNIAGQLSDIIEEVTKFIKTISSLVQEGIKKGGAIAKEIAPKIQESIKRVSGLIVEVSEEVVQISIKIFNAILDELKKHEADIKEYLTAITDFIHDFGKQFSQLAFAIQEELQKFIDAALEQLKDLPIVAMAQEKIAELKQMDIPVEALSVYNDLVDGLVALLPTAECEDFVTTASGYLVKLLKREKFDPEQASKELYTKGEAAIRSLIKKISELVPKQALWKPSKLWNVPLANWVKVPTGGLRISVINWVLSRDLPTIYEVLSAYTPSLTNPLDNIPPFPGVGVVIAGSKIITFDGRYFELSGGCSFVLAQDYVDGNFSISAEFNSKAKKNPWFLDSITIADAKDIITVVRKSKPLLNGAPVEFPVRSGDLGAYITPIGIILRSKAGAKIICDHDLAACQVDVNGFYFNKLRGVLGNLNYEQNDDLLKPDGELAANPSALAAAWKTGGACSVGTPTSVPRQSECTELFSKNPEILIGKPWANTDPWRTMCDHALSTSPAELKQHIACHTAASYVFFARTKGSIFLRVPSECAICKIGDESVEDWSIEQVDVGKTADIVLVVESTEDNKDTFDNLVTPLLAKLKTELDKNGCKDIKVSLISFSPLSKYPTWHTTNGKIEYTKDTKINWVQRPDERNGSSSDDIDLVVATLRRRTGATSLAKAYDEVALKYNFRPQSSKAVIGVHGKPCYSPNNIVVPAKAFISYIYSAVRATSYSLITPVSDLEFDNIEGDDIVALYEDGALTIDGKDHYGDATYERDFCVDSAGLSGNVLPVNNWKKAQAAGKGDEFIKLSAELLAKTITDNKEPQDCHCSLVNGLVPQVRCYVGGLLDD